MKNNDKILFKSCLKNIIASKHHILIWINCLLVTFSIFFLFSAFNVDNNKTYDKYVKLNDNLVYFSPNYSYSKDKKDYDNLNEFEIVYRNHLDNLDYDYIEYNENIKKIFSLNDNFTDLKISNELYNKYFPVAFTAAFRNEYYRKYDKYLNVGDKFILIHGSYYIYYGVVKEILLTTNEDFNELDDIIIVGNNFRKDLFNDIGFNYNPISFKLTKLLYEYDDFCYNNNLNELMYSEYKYSKYGENGYNFSNYFNRTNSLNFNDQNKILHKIIGDLPKNINEIMLPKKYFTIFEENKSNKMINDFFARYNNSFPCYIENENENQYMDTFKITGYYETICPEGFNINELFEENIIVSNAFFDEIYNDNCIDISFNNVLYYLGTTSQLKSIKTHIEKEQVNLHDNNLYVSIINAQTTLNTFYMASTLLGLILLIVCIFGLISFLKNYFYLNDKNIAKLIFSGYNFKKALLISSSVILAYLLFPILITLSSAYFINNALSYLIAFFISNISFNIEFNYINIFLFTILTIMFLVLIILICLLIKNKKFYKKIGNLFK